MLGHDTRCGADVCPVGVDVDVDGPSVPTLSAVLLTLLLTTLRPNEDKSYALH